MLRRIFLVLFLAGAFGAGIFWWLTVPAVVAPPSLTPRTPNLANGVTTFNAGGCSSCHAVPNQPDRLKLGGGLEPPGRVSLTHWPGGNAPWEVGMRQMGGDSAVVIYWHEKVLKPGQRRQFGFAYGLGGVDAGEGAGRLGITLSGSFEPGQVFTVTAYVNNLANSRGSSGGSKVRSLGGTYYDVYYPIKPRVVGVSLRYDY